MEPSNNNMVMPVAPMGYGYGMPFGGMGGFGGLGLDGLGGGWWIILLFLVLGRGFGGFGGGYGMGGGAPIIINNSDDDNNKGYGAVQRGFDQAAVMGGVNGIQNAVATGFGNVQTSLCSGFASVNAAVNNAQNAVAQQLYSNEIADLERSFAAQTATIGGLTNISAQLAQCCADNRQATQDVKYTIATEACNTRAANTANTQAILDKLCQLELDNYKSQLENKNDTIAQLRSQLQFSNLQASQIEQTAQVRAGQVAAVNSLVNELRSCPIPAQPVYGSQPIFTCPNNNSGTCGCGNGFTN